MTQLVYKKRENIRPDLIAKRNIVSLVQVIFFFNLVQHISYEPVGGTKSLMNSSQKSSHSIAEARLFV